MPIDPKTDSALLIGLTKGMAKQLDGVKLAPGVYPVDATFSVHVQGSVEVSEDSLRQMPPDFSWALLLTLLCSKAKLSRDQAKKLIADCAQASIKVTGEEIDCPKRLTDRLVDAAAALDEVKSNNRIGKTYSGATKFSGVVTCE